MQFPEGGITVRPDVQADISMVDEAVWTVSQGTISRISQAMSQGELPGNGGMRSWAALLAGNWLDEPASPQFSAAEIHAHLDTTSAAEVQRAESILEYRKLYPGNAFLTRDQVRSLCKKYNLVFAPMFAFAGEIPARNREEIGLFGLHEKHQEFLVRISEQLTSSMIDFHSNFESEMELPDDQSAPWLLPVTSGFGLYLPQGWRKFRVLTEHYIRSCYNYDARETLAIPMVQTDTGWLRLDPHRLHIMQVDISREEERTIVHTRWFEGSLPRSKWRVRVVFYVAGMPMLRLMDSAGTMHVRHSDMEQMVICPGSMLHENLPLTVSDRWEVQISPQRDVRGVGADPIVLQPVAGGFLVVTKWDAEANLPEVAGQTN